jgi:hypothetical protein
VEVEVQMTKMKVWMQVGVQRAEKMMRMEVLAQVEVKRYRKIEYRRAYSCLYAFLTCPGG